MKNYEQIVDETVECLKKGGIILYPTDTIWGLGCDATKSKAVEKIYKIKQRPENKSLIILLDKFERLKDYVKEVPLFAEDLIKKAENPLSIVYPNAKNLAKNVLAADGSICIRIATNLFCKDVIEKFGKPITSTSANISREKSPLFFDQISDEIKNSVDYVVDLYQNIITEPKASTIIKIELDGSYQIIRP